MPEKKEEEIKYVLFFWSHHHQQSSILSSRKPSAATTDKRGRTRTRRRRRAGRDALPFSFIHPLVWLLCYFDPFPSPSPTDRWPRPLEIRQLRAGYSTQLGLLGDDLAGAAAMYLYVLLWRGEAVPARSSFCGWVTLSRLRVNVAVLANQPTPTWNWQRDHTLTCRVQHTSRSNPGVKCGGATKTDVSARLWRHPITEFWQFCSVCHPKKVFLRLQAD